MRLLFLDIDGVLNSQTWGGQHERWFEILDPEAVAQLRRVVDALPDLRIVVSSAWRIGRSLTDLRAHLVKCGMDPAIESRIIDRTPSLPGQRIRGDEIRTWLGYCTGYQSFAIVDDGADMGELAPRLVQTDWRFGLTTADADRLIALLNGPCEPVRRSA